MSLIHPIYRRFKQIVEAGISFADDETFTDSRERFLRRADLTEAQFEQIEKLNAEEQAYVIEVRGKELIFRRPPPAAPESEDG